MAPKQEVGKGVFMDSKIFSIRCEKELDIFWYYQLIIKTARSATRNKIILGGNKCLI